MWSRLFSGEARQLDPSDIAPFLNSGGKAKELVRAASTYDLGRQGPGDERHVSATAEKQQLRDLLLGDPLLKALLNGLRAMLAYGAKGAPLPSRARLCDLLRDACATMYGVGFVPWCGKAGLILPGRLSSLAECGPVAQSPSRGLAEMHRT